MKSGQFCLQGGALFNRLVGKRLTRLSVYEPWKEIGAQMDLYPPLFGAVMLEFEDVALLCKSPLRFSRKDQSSMMFDDDGRQRSLGFHLTLCSLDEARYFQDALACCGESGSAWPGMRGWRPIKNDGTQALSTYLAMRTKLGCTLTSIHLQSFEEQNSQGQDVLLLNFRGNEQALQISYREDLDGALQVADPGWRYQLDEVVFGKDERAAFGWLSPCASYAIVADNRRWPNLERYLEWLKFKQRRLGSIGVHQSEPNMASACFSAANEREACLEYGMRLKLEQHPCLRRRFLAIRYPVRGLYFDDNLNSVMQSLLLQYRIHAPRKAA